MKLFSTFYLLFTSHQAFSQRVRRLFTFWGLGWGCVRFIRFSTPPLPRQPHKQERHALCALKAFD